VRVKVGLVPEVPKKQLQRKSHLEEVQVQGWGLIAVCHFALEVDPPLASADLAATHKPTATQAGAIVAVQHPAEPKARKPATVNPRRGVTPEPAQHDHPAGAEPGMPDNHRRFLSEMLGPGPGEQGEESKEGAPPAAPGSAVATRQRGFNGGFNPNGSMAVSTTLSAGAAGPSWAGAPESSSPGGQSAGDRASSEGMWVGKFTFGAGGSPTQQQQSQWQEEHEEQEQPQPQRRPAARPGSRPGSPSSPGMRAAAGALLSVRSVPPPSEERATRLADGHINASESTLLRLLGGGDAGPARALPPRATASAPPMRAPPHHSPSVASAVIAEAGPSGGGVMGGINGDRWQPSMGDVLLLERVFDMEPLPGRQTRFQLAEHFAVTARQVQVWFQNKRQRVRVRALKETLARENGVAPLPPVQRRPPHRPTGLPASAPPLLRWDPPQEFASKLRRARVATGGRPDVSLRTTRDPPLAHDTSEAAQVHLLPLPRFETPGHVVARLGHARFEGGLLVRNPADAAPAFLPPALVRKRRAEAVAALAAARAEAAQEERRARAREETPLVYVAPPPPRPEPAGPSAEARQREADVLLQLASHDICEKDPLCTRGFRHRGKGGPCSRKRPAPPREAEGVGVASSSGAGDSGLGHARQMRDAWSAVTREAEADETWLPSLWLLSRCLESADVADETAKRVRQLFDRCSKEPENERLRSSLRRVLLATGRAVVAKAPAGWSSEEEDDSGEEADELEAGGGGEEEEEEEEETMEEMVEEDIGQCSKDAVCTRGFKHGGKGGRCSYAPRPRWVMQTNRFRQPWASSVAGAAAAVRRRGRGGGGGGVAGDRRGGSPSEVEVAVEEDGEDGEVGVSPMEQTAPGGDGSDEGGSAASDDLEGMSIPSMPQSEEEESESDESDYDDDYPESDLASWARDSDGEAQVAEGEAPTTAAAEGPAQPPAPELAPEPMDTDEQEVLLLPTASLTASTAPTVVVAPQAVVAPTAD